MALNGQIIARDAVGRCKVSNVSTGGTIRFNGGTPVNDAGRLIGYVTDPPPPSGDASFAKVTSLCHYDTGGPSVLDIKGVQWFVAGGASCNVTGKWAQGLDLPSPSSNATATYSSAAFDWWVEDYAIECWLKPTGHPLVGNLVPCLVGNKTIQSASTYWAFGPYPDGTLGFYWFNGSVGVNVNTALAVPLGVFSYLGMTYNYATRDFTFAVGASQQVVNGGASVVGQAFHNVLGVNVQSGSQGVICVVDDLRITKGALRTLAVPTAAWPNEGPPTRMESFAFGPTGGILAKLNGVPAFYVNGFALTALGELCIVDLGTPKHWINGIPLDASDRVCVTTL